MKQKAVSLSISKTTFACVLLIIFAFVSVFMPVNLQNQSVHAAGEPTQTMTIYYYSSFEKPYAYFQTVNNPFGELPGMLMKKVKSKLFRIDIKVTKSEKVEIAFNNGYDVWDDNNGNNYFISGKFKVATVLNGKITTKAPDLKKTVSVKLVRPMAVVKPFENMSANTGVVPQKTATPVKTVAPKKTVEPQKTEPPIAEETLEPIKTIKPTPTLVAKATPTPKPVATEEPTVKPSVVPPDEPKVPSKPATVAGSLYKTNPTFGTRAASPITIDGANNGEWSEKNLIAIAAANDDPRTLGKNWTMHELAMDMTHLYAAWDDKNLYLAWQYVDVTDVIDPSNAGSAGNEPVRVQKILQSIAIDTTPGEGAGVDMWEKNGKKPFWTGEDLPDYQIYIASNFWQGFLSKAVSGKFVVDDKVKTTNYQKLDVAGIEGKVGKGLASSTLMGAMDADDVNDSSKVIDFLTKNHDKLRDSFYEMKIPLAAIGNPDIEQNGIGVFLHQGEFSALNSLPHDPAVSNTPGVEDWNSSKEWADIDSFTVPFARIGKTK